MTTPDDQRRARMAIREVLAQSRKVAETRREAYASEASFRKVMTQRWNGLRRALKRFDEATGGKPWFQIDWNSLVSLATRVDVQGCSSEQEDSSMMDL